MERTFLETLCKKIKESGMSQGELAKKAGVSQSSLSRFVNGEIVLSGENVVKIAELFGGKMVFPEDYTPRHTIKYIEQNSPEVEVQGQDLQSIPVYSMAGAGPAVEFVRADMEPLFFVTAPPTYFYRCDFAVVVDGHSMEPTLPHQSVVGVRELTEFKANELYVSHIPYEGLVVKRVAVDRERGEFVFKSDNPDKSAYPDFREPIESATKIIMGRVVWRMMGY